MNHPASTALLKKHQQFFISLLGLIVTVLIYTIIDYRESLKAESNDYQADKGYHLFEIDGSLSSHSLYDLGETVSGNYLAARFLSHQKDYHNASDYYQRALFSSHNDEQTSSILINNFVSMLLSGNIEEAVDLTSEYLEIEHNILLSKMLLSIDDIKHKRYQSAESRLIGLLQQHVDELTDTDMILSTIIIAWAKHGQQDYEGALNLLKGLSAEDKNNSIWRYHEALMHEANGDVKKTANIYRAMFEGDFNSPYEHISAAKQFFIEYGQKDFAHSLYKKYLTQAGYDSLMIHNHMALQTLNSSKTPITTQRGVSEILVEIAKSLYQQQRYNESNVYLYFALHINETFEPANFMLGINLMEQKDFEQANYHFAAIQHDPYLHHYALLHYKKNLYHSGQVDEALQELKKASNSNIQPVSQKDSMLVLANLMKLENRYSEVADIYNKIINKGYAKNSSNEWNIYYNRAVSLEKLGKWDEAESDFIKSLELNPDQPEVLNYLAYSWLEQNKNLNTAKEMIEIAYKANPDDPHIIDSMGWAFYKLGKYKEAVTHLERAVALKPYDPILHDHLGDAYWKIGRKIEAKFQWNHALNYDKEDQYTEILQQKIDHGIANNQSKETKEEQLTFYRR